VKDVYGFPWDLGTWYLGPGTAGNFFFPPDFFQRRDRRLSCVTDNGLEYNLKTCIPVCLANDAGHQHYTSLNPSQSSTPRVNGIQHLCAGN